MRFWVTAATFLFPGFAQGLVHRYKRLAVWAVVALAVLAGSLWEPWCTWLTIAWHLASAIDGYRCYVRDAHMGTNHAAAAIAVVISTVVGGAVALQGEAFRIPASSSYPTLEIGEHVIANKLATRLFGVHRGELVAYHYPCDPTRVYLSRVIALAGDTVAVSCDTVYVNGSAIPRVRVGDESYVDQYDGETTTKQTTRFHEGAHDIYVNDHGPDILASFPTREASCGRPSIVQVEGQLVDAPAPPKADCEPAKLYVVPPGHIFVMGDNRSNANDSRVWGSLPVANVIGQITGIWWSRSFGRIGRVD